MQRERRGSIVYVWTRHIEGKMQHYRLSRQRVRRVIRRPDRVEKGIAPNTIAAMQRADTKRRRQELWVMYQERDQKTRVMISAWRYPGTTDPGEPVTLPDAVREDLQNFFQEEKEV